MRELTAKGSGVAGLFVVVSTMFGLATADQPDLQRERGDAARAAAVGVHGAVAIDHRAPSVTVSAHGAVVWRGLVARPCACRHVFAHS